MAKLSKQLEKTWKKQDLPAFLGALMAFEKALADVKRQVEEMNEIYASIGDDLKTLEEALKNRKLKNFVKEKMGTPKMRSLERAARFLKDMKFDKVAAILADLALEPEAPTALKQLKEIAERVAMAHAKLEKMSERVDKLMKNWW